MQAAKAVLNLQCQASPRHQSPGYPQCLSEPLFWNEGADLSVSYFKGTGHEETHQSLGSDGEEIKSFHQFCCLRVSSTYYEERRKELKVENASTKGYSNDPTELEAEVATCTLFLPMSQ